MRTSQKTYVVSHQCRKLMFTRPAAISHKLDPTWLPINVDLSHQGNMKRFHDVAEQPQAIPELICRNQRADTWHLALMCALKSDSMLCGSPCGLEKPWRHVGTYSTALSNPLVFHFLDFHIELKVKCLNICCIARLLPRLSARNWMQAAQGTSLGVSCLMPLSAFHAEQPNRTSWWPRPATNAITPVSRRPLYAGVPCSSSCPPGDPDALRALKDHKHPLLTYSPAVCKYAGLSRLPSYGISGLLPPTPLVIGQSSTERKRG